MSQSRRGIGAWVDSLAARVTDSLCSRLFKDAAVWPFPIANRSSAKHIMDLLPTGYHLDASTWFYLSLLLVLAVYFRFHRLWSLRNLDLCLLLCVSPGLILVQTAGSLRIFGFSLLFTVTGLFLLRLLFDALLQRRPHTTQNLNPPGLAFLCVTAFVLISMQALSDQQSKSLDETMQRGVDLLHRTDRTDTVEVAAETDSEVVPGPTASIVAAPIGAMFQDLAPRVMAMAAHLAVIVGLLFVGRNLFGDLQLGTAMATLYLLIPCTAYDFGAFNHVLAPALIVWAIVAYQRPLVAGVLMGLACGTLFFPLFLVPLWAAFYGRRGGGRFVAALSVVFVALLGSYILTSADPDSFWRQTMGTIRLPVLALTGNEGAISFWDNLNSPYRTPVIVGYFVMLIGLTVWPRQKSVEHLITHSAALIVGTQFWYPQQGGVYLLWYLPLLLMVIFRPRIAHLEPRQAPATLADIKTTPADEGVRPSRLSSGSRAGRINLFR